MQNVADWLLDNAHWQHDGRWFNAWIGLALTFCFGIGRPHQGGVTFSFGPIYFGVGR